MRIDETCLALARRLIDEGSDGDRLDEAGSLLREALSIRTVGLPEGHWKLAEVEVELALLAQIRDDAAPEGLDASLGSLSDALPAGDFRLARARRLSDPVGG